MTFKVAVIYYSVHGFMVTLANVIAEGARKVRHCLPSAVVSSPGPCSKRRPALLQVPGAEVAVYRVKDPVRGDDSSLYDDGVLDADIATDQVGVPQGDQLPTETPQGPLATNLALLLYALNFGIWGCTGCAGRRCHHSGRTRQAGGHVRRDAPVPGLPGATAGGAQGQLRWSHEGTSPFTVLPAPVDSSHALALVAHMLILPHQHNHDG